MRINGPNQLMPAGRLLKLRGQQQAEAEAMENVCSETK
jgi:hypothetical protein